MAICPMTFHHKSTSNNIRKPVPQRHSLAPRLQFGRPSFKQLLKETPSVSSPLQASGELTRSTELACVYSDACGYNEYQHEHPNRLETINKLVSAEQYDHIKR